MPKRADQFVTQFVALNDELIETVSSCTDDEWRRVSAAEGWPVAVLAHHIAVVQERFTGMIGQIAAGNSFTPTMSMEEVHQSNAQHARDHWDAGRAETLDLLGSSKTAMLQLLRELDDETLERTAGVFGGHELTVEQVVEMIVIGHVREHLASIHATIANEAAA